MIIAMTITRIIITTAITTNIARITITKLTTSITIMTNYKHNSKNDNKVTHEN